MTSKINFAERGEAGFVKAVIIIVIALAALAYFGFDMKEWLDSDTFKNALGAVLRSLNWAWEHIIKIPALWIWNEFIIDIVWEKFLLVILEKVRR